MRDVSDMELLRDYDRQGSEEAFAELVRRHINLVYSVALRHVGIAAQAGEITQAIFIILARKAAGLRPGTILEGWLHETTRLTALSFLRGERRRQFREQEAYMQSTLQESTDVSAWNHLAPLLDEAMARLGKKDRDAVILRFFKQKNVRDVAATLQVNEAAAQRRILRALEKLRKFFTKRGISSTTAIIAGAISANSVQAAPVALAKSVTAVAIAKGATASGSTLTLIKGALKIMAWSKAKTAIVIGAGVLMASVTATITVQEIESHGTLTIRMHVDGSDFLRVSGNQLWFEHAFYVRPDNPIYVNGRPWSPTWDGNVSTKYTGLKPAFNPHNPQRIQLAVTAGRGPVSIAHLPAPDNNQTLSVLIDDNDYDGQDWYEFTISW
jgi:RNA polymerase sigma factor (sigma-70 family)